MKFRSSGKLLITGEYLVLKGAKALALPTRFGQEMEVSYQETKESPTLIWDAFDSNNKIWFQTSFELPSLKLISTTDEEKSQSLYSLLSLCFRNNPELYKENSNIQIKTYLEFPNDWGLGSSSTLISNLSKWSKVDAFKLLKSISKGSGFDVAVALENKAIIYQILDNKPTWKPVNFNPNFLDKIYFIHLNQKQKSEKQIELFEQNSNNLDFKINKINDLTLSLINDTQISEFEIFLDNHENIISDQINSIKIQDDLFPDYQKGVVKSLGAWGGDFVLVTIKNENDLNYFREKGYDTILSYDEMILT